MSTEPPKPFVEFAERVAPRAGTQNELSAEPVATVAHGGVVAEIFHTPDARRAGYMVKFHREFKDNAGKEMVASDLFTRVDMKDLKKAAELAEKRMDELSRQRSSLSR